MIFWAKLQAPDILLLYRMSTSERKHDETKRPPTSSSTVILLLGDIADTTWRMFVPTLGLGALGFWADMIWHTAPWLSIIGVIIGAALAGALVWQQLKKVDNDN